MFLRIYRANLPQQQIILVQVLETADNFGQIKLDMRLDRFEFFDDRRYILGNYNDISLV